MQFKPFVFDRVDQQIPVSIAPMTQADAELTNLPRQTLMMENQNIGALGG